ncbi:transposase [Candidatus Roizmanbacteria bacterium]|nr:transposase [Candidatus Roizmanbacteria bacterium]
MKKYKCPVCLSTSSVIRYGYRKKILRLFCKQCSKSFSVNTCFVDKKSILNDHLDGLSFRKLARKYGISKSHAWDICQEELQKLPNNNQFTFRYCNRFSHIFLFDGKYFNVASSKYDWVLLWGIDYFRHDIPIFIIAPSENYQSWSKFFFHFRLLNHHPQLLVCDDNVNLKMAARKHFPQVKIQTCYNHFKENIRRNLHIRSDKTNQYRDFMRRIESVLSSSQKISDETLNHWLWTLYRDYHKDPLCLSILTTIEKYKSELLSYRNIHQAPLTTNLIEGMNSHLEARLQALRSFQTVEHAKLWWNGFILKRRLTPFTDCRGKFRFLRGKTGVEMTKKQGIAIPTYF